MKTLSDEEKLYNIIHASLKERMRGFPPGLELKAVRNQLRGDIARELEDRGIAEKVPPKLFERVFIDLRKESVYLNQILPEVIQKRNSALREDFLDTSILDSLRENKTLSNIGGGERI